MASEIRVDKINSLSGVGTVTLSPTGVDIAGITTVATFKVGTGVTASSDGDIFATGVTTSTTFVGALTGNVTGNISGGTVAGSTGTFTGDVDIADKIVHTGDTNTAIRFPGADTITTETAGVERARITSEGRLLIGKTSGTAKVDVDASDNTIRITKAAVSNYCGFQLDRDNSNNAGGYLGLSGSAGHYINNSVQHDLCLRSESNLLFSTSGNTEKARIDTNGYIGVGLNDPHLYYSKTLVVGAETEGDGGGITIKGASTHTNYLMFADSNSGAARYDGYIGYNHSTQKLLLGAGAFNYAQLDSTGDLTIVDGDLVIGTSGHGIDFSATSDASGQTSELLDDYEEGNWTPTVNASHSVSSVVYAKYVKIGRFCNITAYFTLNNNTGDGNAFVISGLPFTSLTNAYSPNVIDVGRGGKKGAYSRVTSNGNHLDILYASENTGVGRYTLKGNEIAGNDYIIIAANYHVN